MGTETYNQVFGYDVEFDDQFDWSEEPVLDTQMVNINDKINGTLVSDLQPQPRVKARRKKSPVWEFFRIEKVDANSERAFCKQCNKSFAFLTGTKLAGTSHLNRHIFNGICPKGKEENLIAVSAKSRRNGFRNGTNRPKRSSKQSDALMFDPERCNLDMAKMIIQHDYPLQMVEHSDSLARALNSQYTSVDMNTVEDHIVRIHLEEKQKLMNLLAGIRGRVSLGLDLWTSDQGVGYAVLKGHFVDSEWKLQRRVLSVIALSVPDSETALNGALNACLNDWSMNRKILAITLNQPFGIETIRHSLRSLLSAQKSDSQSSQDAALLGDQLVTGSCYARVLSNLAHDALVFGRQTIEKVRTSVKCVLVSDLFHGKFRDVKQQLQVRSSKTLIYDDITNWKTTYEMLVAASELKEVFSCLDFLGANMPSVDEWIQVQTLCTYLKHLHDAASILASKMCPTSNIFFHEVCRIYKELMDASSSNDQFLSSLANLLKEKFERYWCDTFLILAIAAVMDPRYKLKVVKMRLSMMHLPNIESWMTCIQDGVRELYTEYCKDGSLELCTDDFQVDGAEYRPDEGVSKSVPEEGNEVKHEVDGEQLEMPEVNGEQIDVNGDLVNHESNGGFGIHDISFDGIDHTVPHDELVEYLDEEPLDYKDYGQDFDVLGWWRDNSTRYPILSKMAADVLAVPLSTASPDSVFHAAGGRMQDSVRSGLRPALVEALLCTKDWFKYGSLDLDSIEMTTSVKIEC